MLWRRSEKKQEFAGLNARNDDVYCFTSHAGFPDVGNIAQFGLHVDQYDYNSIGQWASVAYVKKFQKMKL